MSDTLTAEIKQEVAPQIILGEPKDIDPSMGIKEAIAAKLQKDIGLGKTGRESLVGLMEEGEVASIKVDGSNAQKAIEQNLTGDPRKKAHAEARDLLVRDFLSKKYEALTPANQLKMRNSVEQALRAWEPGEEFLDNLADPAKTKEIIEKLLSDSEFRTILEQQYNGLFNTDPPQWKAPDDPNDSPEIAIAEKKYRLAQVAVQDAEDEQAKIQKGIREIIQKEQEHDTTRGLVALKRSEIDAFALQRPDFFVYDPATRQPSLTPEGMVWLETYAVDNYTYYPQEYFQFDTTTKAPSLTDYGREQLTNSPLALVDLKGAKAREIASLEKNITVMDGGDGSYVARTTSDRDSLKEQRDEMRRQQKQKGADVVGIGQEIERLTGEIDTLDSNVRNYNILVNRKKTLTDERDGLAAEKTALEKQEMEKFFEIGEKAKEASVDQADLEELRMDLSRRGGGMTVETARLKAELVSKLDGIVTKATKEWIKTQLGKIDSRIETDWTDLENERDSRAEKAMIKNIRDLYRRSPKDKAHFWSREKNARAEQDFQILVDPDRGIDAVFEDQLLLVAKEWPEEYFVYDMSTHEPAGISDMGREQFNTVHKDFAERVKMKLAKTTMERKMETGGVSKKEVAQIMESDWLKELIEDDKEGIGKKIDEAMHREGVVGPRLKWLNDKANSGLGLTALFLLFGPIPPIIVYAANRKKGGGSPAH